MGQLIKKFGKIKVSLPIPHLLTLQIDSYQKFLQEGVAPADRKPDVGLEGVFRTVSPSRISTIRPAWNSSAMKSSSPSTIRPNASPRA